MFHILASLFCLCFTATSYCNSLWPAFMTSNLIIFPSGLETSSWTFWALASLLFFIFVSLETYLYHWFLKGISYVQALRYAIAANITTLPLILSFPLFFILGQLFQSILYLLVTNNPPKAAIIALFVTFNALIEFTIMRFITGYPSKKLIVPVLSGYVLTIAILILGQLLFGLQK